MNEIDLIRSCRLKERKGQHQLYTIFADRLYRLAMRYIRNQQEAEDVVIVSFHRILSQLTSFEYRGEGSFEAWMRKIVVNDSLQWLRRSHNFNLTETMDLGMPEPDLSEMSALEAEDIQKMIDSLPVGYRTVFNLYVVEGFDHREIGALLQISENTSRTQLFKAKSSLKKILKQEGYYYGT